MKNKSLRGSLLLLLGSMIWGAAFAAQRVGMEHMGPFYFSGIRMLLAGIVMIPVTAWLENRDRINGRTPPAGKKFSGWLIGGEFYEAGDSVTLKALLAEGKLTAAEAAALTAAAGEAVLNITS